MPGRFALAMVTVVVLLAAGCSQEQATPEAPPADAPAPAATQLANPASTNCIAVGGRLDFEKDLAGARFGVCLFEDNHQCEEWALLRGECPVGGRRITGYATQAGRYCAITGGQYTVTSGTDSSNEKGTCTLPGGKVCDAEAYYGGTCGR